MNIARRRLSTQVSDPLVLTPSPKQGYQCPHKMDKNLEKKTFFTA